MIKVFPFRAVMPTADCAAAVAAPPYDVVSTEEARQLAANNDLSFLRVSRPELELPGGTDIYSDEVYKQAARNYHRLRTAAPLHQDKMPHFYLYAQTMGTHRQVGIVAAASVDDYVGNRIKKHEKTRRQKEDDRTRHIMTLRSQTGPVFLLHADNAEIDAIIKSTIATQPRLFDFIADDGIGHTVWRLDTEDNTKIIDAFLRVDSLYIADGHHRAASAARACEAMQAAGQAHGTPEHERFLSVIFAASQLRILPYNRVVSDLNGMQPAQLLAEAAKVFTVSAAAAPVPEAAGNIHMYLQKQWYKLSVAADAIASLSPVDQLDVSLLQDRLLAPLLGIDDPRSNERIDFIGGIRGTDELQRLVDSGKAAVAFSMFPTTVAQLMAIADAGQIMPPKSTWFEPKLRDGLLIHDI